MPDVRALPAPLKGYRGNRALQRSTRKRELGKRRDANPLEFASLVVYSPLWKPLCYAQIGRLAVATFITLLLVPVFYSIAVLDLRIVKWETRRAVDQEGADDLNISNAQ